jgi:hypothetical protein
VLQVLVSTGWTQCVWCLLLLYGDSASLPAAAKILNLKLNPRVDFNFFLFFTLVFKVYIYIKLLLINYFFANMYCGL